MKQLGQLILQPGTRVTYLEQEYVIQQLLDLKSALVFNPKRKRSEVVLINQLQSLEVKEIQIPTQTPDLGTIPDEDWQVANQRFEIIKPLLEYAPNLRSKHVVRTRAKEFKKSEATVYRWIEAYSKQRKVSALLPKGSRSDRGGGRLDNDVETIISATIQEWLKATPRQSVQDCCFLAIKRCQHAKLKPPSPNSVRVRISRLSEREKYVRKHGERAAHVKFDPLTGSYPGADYPLAVVQVDHTKADIILVDEKYRRSIGRPWITVAIDVFSRMIIGLYVSLDPPSANSVGLCLSQAILPKESWLIHRGITEAWSCWGFPHRVFVDNGKEFHGEMLEMACRTYNIDLEFRPPLTPEMGGHIERLVGSINTEVQKMPGTTFSNPKKRADYDSTKQAAFTLLEFEEYLATWVVGVYHHRFHEGLLTTPLARYEEGIIGNADQPGTGLPDPNDPRLDPERLRLDFMPLVKRHIGRKGIRIDHIFYQGEPLFPYIHALRSNQKETEEKFTFRRDPRYIGKVYFYDPKLRQYFTIPYRNATNPDISVWELREVRRWMRDHGLTKVNETTIFKARERMQQIREGAVQQTSATRRRQQRKVEAKRDVVPNPPKQRPSPVALQAQSQKIDPTNPVKPTPQALAQEPQSNFTPSEPLPVVKKPFSGSVLQLEED